MISSRVLPAGSATRATIGAYLLRIQAVNRFDFDAEIVLTARRLWWPRRAALPMGAFAVSSTVAIARSSAGTFGTLPKHRLGLRPSYPCSRTKSLSHASRLL